MLKINSPEDLRKQPRTSLPEICHELREYIIKTVTETGGHLAPSLGAVELTVALHYVLRTPHDRLIWDVGHQAYSHKILTGRRDSFPTIRQFGGLSGFCRREESEYDVFGAGHASTSISAAVGIARARDLKGEDFRVAAVIGDGSLTGGLAYEGLNNAGELKSQLLVIINDNEMSISPNVGAISGYLTRMVTNPLYNRVRDEIWKALGKIPRGTDIFRPVAKKVEESVKTFLTPGIIFEQLGFRYFGPIDGHDVFEMMGIFNRVKDIPVPVVVHVLTKKGKGLERAESDPTKYHGIGPIKKDSVTKEDKKDKKEEIASYNQIFGKIALSLVQKMPEIHFISAAMVEGTGLTHLQESFPDRVTDVGIAEGHAVTFSGGLAVEGLRPVVAIYSTFLQRAYDHIIHDIALQNLPVVFALDRAGLVGADGATHHGVYDLTYLCSIPGMIVSAPRDGNELRDLLKTALNQNEHPFAIRYPKDCAIRFDEDDEGKILEIGKWEVMVEGKELAILAVGSMVDLSLKAIQGLEQKPTLINARFVKPLDEELLMKLTSSHSVFLTLEENTIMGGFGAQVQRFCFEQDLPVKVRTLGIPDSFVEHGTRQELLHQVGLDKEGISCRIKDVMRLE